MLRRFAVAVLAAVLAFGLTPLAAAPALPQTPLEWRFKEGDQFFMEETTALKIKVMVMGAEVEQSQDTTMVTRVKVVKKTEEGNVTLEFKIQRMIAGGNQPGGEAMAEALKGLIFKATMNKTLEVAKFDGYDAFIKAVDDIAPGTGDQLKALMGPEAFQGRLTDVFRVLPGKSVEQGDKWKYKSSAIVGVGSPSMESTFVSEGSIRVNDQSLEKITFKSQLKFTPPEKQNPAAPFRITKLESKGGETGGTILHDGKAGRIVSWETNYKALEMDMSLEIGGNAQNITMLLNGSTTIRISEDMPKEK